MRERERDREKDCQNLLQVLKSPKQRSLKWEISACNLFVKYNHKTTQPPIITSWAAKAIKAWGSSSTSKSIKNWDMIWPGVGPLLSWRYNHTHLQKHCCPVLHDRPGAQPSDSIEVWSDSVDFLSVVLTRVSTVFVAGFVVWKNPCARTCYRDGSFCCCWSSLSYLWCIHT